MNAQKDRAFRHDFMLALVPAVLWGVLFLLRPYFYTAWCGVDPSPCLPDTINFFDRLAFDYGSVRADFWSNVVQNTTGGIAFLMPFLIYYGQSWRKAFHEFWLLGVVSLWNGVFLEIVRSLVQRPRPMVFHNPLANGIDVHQYTSFYSGHTSFTALASLGLFFMIRRRYPHQKWIQLNFFFFFLSATLLTGALRVIGGRHYPTDVIAGFIVGCEIGRAHV